MILPFSGCAWLSTTFRQTGVPAGARLPCVTLPSGDPAWTAGQGRLPASERSGGWSLHGRRRPISEPARLRGKVRPPHDRRMARRLLASATHGEDDHDNDHEDDPPVCPEECHGSLQRLGKRSLIPAPATEAVRSAVFRWVTKLKALSAARRWTVAAPGPRLPPVTRACFLESGSGCWKRNEGLGSVASERPGRRRGPGVSSCLRANRRPAVSGPGKLIAEGYRPHPVGRPDGA